VDGRHAHRDLQQAAVLALSDRLVVVDPIAHTDPAQNLIDLGVAIIRHEDRDVAADGLSGPEPVQTLGGGVPGQNGPVQALREDGVVRPGDNCS
jgi:hypothetical protein